MRWWSGKRRPAPGGGAADAPTAGADAVTAVVTTCERPDLLKRTLDSFHAHNSFPLARLIVVHDGADLPDAVKADFRDRPIEWISTGRRVGQVAAVDYAYSRIDTPYIFHLEDDWEFYRSGFIERSLAVLRDNVKCLQVWIRALNDTQRHPVEPLVRRSGGVEWRRMALDYRHKDLLWHGFSFNPGLRRLDDYVSIGGYGRNARFDFAKPGNAEAAIARVYRRRDFFAAILSDEDGRGYVRHIGKERHVGPPEPPAR